MLSMGTPLGDDVLVPRTFSGVEALSHPFSYTLEMLSGEHDIRAQDIVGENVNVALKLSDDSRRYFNGYVRRFTGRSRFVREYRCYEAEIAP